MDASPSAPDVAAPHAVVDFFRSLPVAARREYERLAELDRRFGEDVRAERADREAER